MAPLSQEMAHPPLHVVVHNLIRPREGAVSEVLPSSQQLGVEAVPHFRPRAFLVGPQHLINLTRESENTPLPWPGRHVGLRVPHRIPESERIPQQVKLPLAGVRMLVFCSFRVSPIRFITPCVRRVWTLRSLFPQERPSICGGLTHNKYVAKPICRGEASEAFSLGLRSRGGTGSRAAARLQAETLFQGCRAVAGYGQLGARAVL